MRIVREGLVFSLMKIMSICTFCLYLTQKNVKNKKGAFIEPNKDNNLLKTSHLNYKQLIIKPIAFYAVRAFIDKDTMYKIFVEITKFFKEIRSENDSKVLELAHDFINKSYCDADAPKSKGYLK